MASRPQLRVLFFDVFGTCVAQRKPVADELWTAATEALDSDSPSMDEGVRSKALQMDWNKDIDVFTAEIKAKTNNVDWRAVDRYRLVSLHKLLAQLGLIIPTVETDTAEPHAKEGSLWDDEQLKQVSLVWHRLPPWPDTCRGLELLNRKFSTVALSNTYNELMQGLVAHSSIPFHHVYTSDMFQSFKPNPKVYLGAAEKLGVKPEECGLVASHLFDLKGAKACGFYAISVERPLEEKNPELQKEGIPDLRVEEGNDGFVTLAGLLGIE